MPDGADDPVLASYAAFNARFEQLRTLEGIRAFHSEFFTPDMVVDNVEHFPVPTSYQGFDEYRRWFEETLAPYEDVRWTVDRAEPLDEHRVLVLAAISGHPPGDPTLLEVRLALIHTVRDGKISRIEVFLSEDAARAAADSAP